MQFLRVNGWTPGTTALTKRLQHELKGGKRVLWLVCGGSNIPAIVKVMKALPDEETKNLAILLTDERYGEVGHTNSNAQQLYNAGFTTKQAIFVPVLAPGFTLEETKERYTQVVERAFAHAEVIIGQFGIGNDGHIAGILPHSEAASAEGWVAAYATPEYTRVTLTFRALKKLTAAYAIALGEAKKQALEKLQNESLPLPDEPSQILKELPEAYIYNDQVGDKT